MRIIDPPIYVKILIYDFSEIIRYASEIESRLSDEDYTMDSLKADNRKVINGFKHVAEQVVMIDSSYEQTIKALLN